MSDQYGNPIPPTDAGYDFGQRAEQGANYQQAASAYQVPSSMEGAQSSYHAAYTAQAQSPVSYYGTEARSGKKKRSSGGGLKSFLMGIVGGIVAMAIISCLGSVVPMFKGLTGGGSVTSSGGTITIENIDDATIAQAVAAKDLDSVVTIYVYSSQSGWSDFFGSGNSSNTPNALGSGVIIKVDGKTNYVLTNYHVVENISRAVVKSGEEEFEASMVGYDAKSDLAVIKFTAEGKQAIEWGDSSKLTVGEWVMAIGSPYGYEQTVTTGIVSALYRSDVLATSDGLGYSVYTDMIQTDAAINPGNSGGALVNAEGELIGINTYISSTSQSSAGLGFAIPSNEAKRIAEQLMSGQKASHAFLGISMQQSSDPAGVAVAAVYKGTAAAEAGLRTGDVITKIDGKTIKSTNEVSVAVSSKHEGDKVSITFIRDGQENTVEATLGSDDTASEEFAEGGEPVQQPDNGPSDMPGDNGFGNDGGSGGYGYDLEDLFGEMFGNGYGDGSFRGR